MKNVKTLFILLTVVAISFSSCKKEASDDDKATVLREYLVAQNMDLDHIIKNLDGQKFVMGAPADGDVSGKHVIDIRSQADYDAGHIEGAVRVDFANILTEAAKASKPMLLVCYTGQTACYATSLLRLYGYSDAQALKWGMSGWSASTDGWSSKVGDTADGHANWTTAAAPSNSAKDWATFSSMGSDGLAILQERVATVIANGFKKVAGTTVLENPSDYYINNYFSDADYTGFGHINGAYRVQPLLISDNSISTLDPSQKVVTYCYTGQTSAIITAFLNVLGYDAYSMAFGMNGIYNSNSAWTSNQWGGDSNPKDLPLVQ